MYCAECGKRIYEGDTYYDVNGSPICPECVRDYLDENCREFGDDGEEIYVVDMMGYDVEDLDLVLRNCERTLNYDESAEPSDPRYEPEYWYDR